MNEPIGINPENRRDTSSKKATGFVAEGLDYRDLNEALLKSHCDHIWGTSAQCTANTATFYTNNTTGVAYDKDAVLVTFADDDKILISHSAATVNMKLDCGGSKIRIEMSKAENWDLGTKNLILGVTAGDSFSGDLELTGTGTLTVLESDGLRVNHSAMTVTATAGDIVDNSVLITDTQSADDNSKKAATTAYVDAESELRVPAGTIMAYGSETLPPGYLKCNGALLDRTTYANLFSAIGTSYGTTSGSNFAAPDMRGMFIRGWSDDNTANEPDRASRSAQGTGGQSGNNVGSIEDDQLQGFKIRHPHQSNGVDSGGYTGSFASGASYLDSTPINDGVNGTPRTGLETRPANINVMYIIKT